MFGDLGWTDNQILPYLREEVTAGIVDAVILYGDMVSAYTHTHTHTHTHREREGFFCVSLVK